MATNEEMKGIIRDQAVTIDGLKRALAGAMRDLETVLATVRIVRREEKKAKETGDLFGDGD